VPRVRRRTVDPDTLATCLADGIDPLLARIIAARPVRLSAGRTWAGIAPSLSQLDAPSGLPDVGPASARIVRAIRDREPIAIETDHDCDGVTSHAVILQSLLRFGHPREQCLSFIGHRLTEGYGLSAALAARILASTPRPTLVITADNGSSDEPRIAMLKSVGIDTIVTDHHELPVSGPPPSALACVTPNRADSEYPDRMIAGCMVAWLLMCAVRRRLIDVGHLPDDAPTLGDLLDFVALGTVADCVSLAASVNNRAVVRHGLQRINAGTRACWRALRPKVAAGRDIDARDLAFIVAPRINARGRLDEAMPGVRFLLAESDATAIELEALLSDENDARKRIEGELKSLALRDAAAQAGSGALAIVSWLPDGHPGVHGIVASRIVESFGRPAVCLSPKVGDGDRVTGSARGIPGLHVRDALQHVSDAEPRLLEAFGGHAGAGGLTIQRDGIERFRAAFELAVRGQLGSAVTLHPVLWSDGPIESSRVSVETIRQLATLEPYGRQFEPPMFDDRFVIDFVRPVGNGTHLKMSLRTLDASSIFDAIWFRAKEADAPLPVREGQVVGVAYSLEENVYRDISRVQLVIRQVWTGDPDADD
jgi:single-stranded-DNA-specific exonuclease